MIFVTRIQPMKFISLALALNLAICAASSSVVQAETSPLLIYQLQTGTSGSASQEYMTIYNNTAQPANVTGWCIVYASSSDVTQTQLGCLKPPNTSTKLLLSPYSSLLLATAEMVQISPGLTPDIVFAAGIAGTSGHIKLLDPDKNIIDVVGWGSAVHPENTAANSPATGKILQRHNTAEVLQDSNNNSLDFYHADLKIMPGGSIFEESTPLTYGPMPILSEILPDVSGADAGKEFIEFYNPTDELINLKLFSLALGPTFSKSYPLPSIVIESKSYISLSDTVTGLTLPNTSASLRLIGPNDAIVSEVTYSELEEDSTLAYINGNWQKTYTPTPGVENILTAIKPCPEGQTRSAETNQCKTITLAASALECKIGQARNPETGRCKNIVSATGASTICKPGQEKNPATNRCRNILIAAAAKPCPAGQERNSQTGRCRKITALASAGTNSVKDVPSPLVTNNIKWWIVGAAAFGTVAYAVYEWRNEVIGFTVNLKNKLVPG